MKHLLLSTLLFGMSTLPAQAQVCERGSLGAGFCDQNKDLVADAPAQTVDPKTLVVGFAVVDDPSVTKAAFTPYVEELGRCTKRPVKMEFITNEALVMEAMRTGQVHISYFGTGATMYAVNFAGAVPFAGKGFEAVGKPVTYQLHLISRAENPYVKTLSDLKGQKVAHTSKTSNSGHLAPLALFPAKGLIPDKDYQVVFSGRHDKSILGVKYGFWAGAAIATDVYDRMVQRAEVDPKEFKILFKSDDFPTDAMVHAHNLDPKLAADIKRCSYEFQFPPTMQKALEGTQRFYPLEYKRDWALVRTVAQASGQVIDAAAYQALLAKATAKK
jgi:phosphonate transport system substrate-binding protein